MTSEEIKCLKKGDIIYLRHCLEDAPETVRFIRYDDNSGLAIINHKEKFTKGGFGQTGHCCLLSKLSTI